MFKTIFLFSIIVHLVSAPLFASDYKFDLNNFGREAIEVHLPKNFETKEKWPLLISMHGYTGNIEKQNKLFRLKSQVSKLGFILINISGIKNSAGHRFWNASNFCCDFEKTKVNDIKYLKEVISEAIGKIGKVNTQKIYLHGHSNGAFLSFRAACEMNDQIAAILSVAGSMDLRGDNEKLILDRVCKKSNPIPVIHLHGTKDETIKYDGADKGRTGHLASNQMMKFWSKHNDCQEQETKKKKLTGDRKVIGKKIEVTAWTQCRAGSQVWHYKMQSSGHVPFLKKSFQRLLLNKLFQFSL